MHETPEALATPEPGGSVSRLRAGIIAEVSQAGPAGVSPRTLVERVARDQQHRKDVKSEIRSLLDQGELELGAKLQLVYHTFV